MQSQTPPRRVGRPRQQLPIAEAQVRQMLSQQTLRDAASQLDISPATAFAWRQRLGIRNPHVPYTRRGSEVPWAKGLTWAVIEAALLEHPEGLHLSTLTRQLDCSRQAVWAALLKWEKRGRILARYRPSGRRDGWMRAAHTLDERSP